MLVHRAEPGQGNQCNCNQPLCPWRPHTGYGMGTGCRWAPRKVLPPVLSRTLPQRKRFACKMEFFPAGSPEMEKMGTPHSGCKMREVQPQLEHVPPGPLGDIFFPILWSRKKDFWDCRTETRHFCLWGTSSQLQMRAYAHLQWLILALTLSREHAHLLWMNIGRG